jgi:hypothetical protein
MRDTAGLLGAMYGENLAIHAEGGGVSATFFAMDHVVTIKFSLG